LASAKLRNEILSIQKKNFSRPISEKEWLKNSSKIWELIKRNASVNEYFKMLVRVGDFG